jgi:3-phosphoshikimate 1-carboxyvinyltransferase
MIYDLTSRVCDVQITLPGSKSLTNRVLLLSALSQGTTVVKNVLESADTRYMLEALKQLQVSCFVRIDL